MNKIIKHAQHLYSTTISFIWKESGLFYLKQQVFVYHYCKVSPSDQLYSTMEWLLRKYNWKYIDLTTVRGSVRWRSLWSYIFNEALLKLNKAVGLIMENCIEDFKLLSMMNSYMTSVNFTRNIAPKTGSIIVWEYFLKQDFC